MRKWWPALVGVVALAVVGVVLVLSRTGGGSVDDPATAAPSPSPTSTAVEMTAAELEALVFAADLGTSDVLGSVKGVVGRGAAATTARVDVTDIRTTEHSTLVLFTLVNTSGENGTIHPQVFNARRMLARDIRDVALVDPEAGTRYWPYLGESRDGTRAMCACATSPVVLAANGGQLLSATFPPLDPGTRSVTLEVPGFPGLEVAVPGR